MITEQPRWQDNFPLFKLEREDGLIYEKYVAKLLGDAGLDVELGPVGYAETVEEREAWKPSIDVIVRGNKRTTRIEVKSRRVNFTKPTNFPYPDIIVCTKSSWEGYTDKPDFFVHVSKETEAIVVNRSVPHEREQWFLRKDWDNVRKFRDWYYHCPRKLLYDWDRLIAYLMKKHLG